MKRKILEIREDFEGLLSFAIGDAVAWEASDELKNQLLNDLEKLSGGGDDPDIDDTIILDTIKQIKSCIRSQDFPLSDDFKDSENDGTTI